MANEGQEKQKIYKGNKEAPESLVNEILSQVKSIFKSNNQIYLLKGIVDAFSQGSEKEIRTFVNMIKHNGASNVEISLKDSETYATYKKDMVIPSLNIGYLLPALMSGAWKDKVEFDKLKVINSKYSNLSKELRDLENEAINIVVEGDISVAEIPSAALKRKINTKKTKKISKKNKKTRKQESSRVSIDEKNDSELPKESDKTVEGWKTYAKENNINISGLTSKSDIYNKIFEKELAIKAA